MMLATVETSAVATRPRYRCRACSECGSEFTPQAVHAEFCSAPCRKAFNNRRMVRGAELYDLFMTLRYERALAVKLKVWALLCRMAMGYREEDVDKRAGRKSWSPARNIIERRPYLRAVVVAKNIAGARRS